MGIVFRQSVKSSIVIFFGAFLGFIVVYLSTLYLEKQEYGFVRYLTTQAVVAGQLTMLGMCNTLLVFVHRYADDLRKKKLLLTICVFAPVVATAILSVPYFLLKDRVIQIFQSEDVLLFQRYYYLLPIYVLLWSLLLVMEIYLNSQMKVALSLFMREVVLRVANITVIVLFAMGLLSFEWLAILSVLIHALPVALLFILSYRTEGFGFSMNWRLFSKEEYYSIAHYSWYHLLVGVSVNLMGYLDALMLGPLDRTGMNSVAIYTVAVYIISLAYIPYRAMATATLPNLTQAFEQGDMKKVEDLFNRSGINILIVTILMAVLLICNLNNMVLVLREGYEAIAPLIIILLIGRVADMGTGMNHEMISISKYYKFNFYLTILLVVMIFVFNRLLIPRLGIFGAAWGTSAAMVIFNMGKLIFLWKKMGLMPFSKKTPSVLLAGLVAGLAGYFLPFIYHPIVDAVIRSGLVVVVYSSLVLWFRSSADLQLYLLSVKEKKRLF